MEKHEQSSPASIFIPGGCMTRLDAAVPSEVHPGVGAAQSLAVRVSPPAVQHQVDPQASRLGRPALWLGRVGGGGVGVEGWGGAGNGLRVLLRFGCPLEKPPQTVGQTALWLLLRSWRWLEMTFFAGGGRAQAGGREGDAFSKTNAKARGAGKIRQRLKDH